jgi:glucoamylase
VTGRSGKIHRLEDWGRRQNDGPASEAITLIDFANYLIESERGSFVREQMYDGKSPSNSIIKRNLEFTAHHWRENTFDLWEEVPGLHFYTLVNQRAALLAGAKFATRMNDPGAADFYLLQAGEIEKAPNERFWDETRGSFVATLEQPGWSYRESGLDIAVVLAALHADIKDNNWTFSVIDDRILATANRLQKKCSTMCGINTHPEFRDLGTAMFRYPEDHWDGYGRNAKANPWFIATSAMAELNYKAAKALLKIKHIDINQRNLEFFSSLKKLQGLNLNINQRIEVSNPLFYQIINALIAEGDRYIARVERHVDQDFNMSEQYHRDSGYMQGAQKLTWSFAAYITAKKSRPTLFFMGL